MKFFEIGHNYTPNKNIQIQHFGGKNQPANQQREKSRQEPKCAMCRNHGHNQLTKGHIKCDFKTPEHLAKCNECRLTEERRATISREIKILRDRAASSRNRENQSQVLILSRGRQRRQQMCRKCGFHGLQAPMRMHKNECPFKDCTCDKGCKEVLSRCTAFNNEAKLKRKQCPKLPEQPKITKNFALNIQVDDKATIDKLPQFDSIFCSKSNNFADPLKEIDYTSHILDPFSFVNLEQVPLSIENKMDFSDQFQTYCSVSDPILNNPNAQFTKNKYSELDSLEYDIEIASVIANFANENFESFYEVMDYCKD